MMYGIIYMLAGNEQFMAVLEGVNAGQEKVGDLATWWPGDFLIWRKILSFEGNKKTILEGNCLFSRNKHDDGYQKCPEGHPQVRL